MFAVRNGICYRTLKRGEKMKKRKLTAFFLIGIASSLFLYPIHSWAKSTAMTITFSSQERETAVDPPIDVPLIRQTKVNKNYESTFLAYSNQRLTSSSQNRLPTTGEEYTIALSYLGWATLICVTLFFFIGRYEQKGRSSRE